MFENIHFNKVLMIWIIILKQLSSRAEVTVTKRLAEDIALAHLPKYWKKYKI